MSYILANGGSTITLNCNGGGGSDPDNWEEDIFQNVNGNSVIANAVLPADNSQVFVYVNGIRNTPGLDYNKVANTIQFTYQLTSDNVLLQYKNQ